ncbi:MAG: hypothetical protein Q4Q22_02815 [Methanosphaera sp.]|nr:hypothetical protein [Methanosphaera sp.]
MDDTLNTISILSGYKTIVEDILNEDKDIERRIELADAINDEKILMLIARHSDNPMISKNCIDKIEDDDLLYELVMEDKKYENTRHAVRKIKNKNMLLNMLKNIDCHDTSLAQVIIENLSECNMLSEVILGDDYDYSFRMLAIEEISKEYSFLLRNIFLNRDDKNSLEKSCGRINDERFLYTTLPDSNVILYGSQKDFYNVIIDIIDDNHLLTFIINNSDSIEIRKMASDKIDELSSGKYKKSECHDHKNQDYKRNILKSAYKELFKDESIDIKNLKEKQEYLLLNPNVSIRMNAVKTIKDQQVLKTIVFKDPEITVRHHALDKISDEDVIKDIYDESEYTMDIRLKCIEKITDNIFIKEILIKTPEYINIVFDRLDDEDIITNLILNHWNDEFYEYSRKLLVKIDNPLNLIDIASRADNWRVRKDALVMLEESPDFSNEEKEEKISHHLLDQAYHHICTKGEYTDVKIRSVNKIGQKEILEDLTISCEDDIVRSIAFRRLNAMK